MHSNSLALGNIIIMHKPWLWARGLSLLAAAKPPVGFELNDALVREDDICKVIMQVVDGKL